MGNLKGTAMRRRFDISSYAAIPAILALAGAAFVLKPAELRRNPFIEAQGMAGLAAQYEVMYARCKDNGVHSGENAAGITAGFVGGFSHQFPATSDADAAAFVKKARPQCEVASLYRLERQQRPGAHSAPFRRTRISV